MAKIPLRAYINEIETIIEQNQIDEGIAHCHHILQLYPKHIDTYRMLGKAYLESRNYGSAIDIFKRVLSAIPYDFISHVGMSITREDEGNLDAAIWHMERAFEGQPYNAAIQGELRRLYGKRDGMEPPKIYLTRGALARMYAKGNLFQQAIAEFRAVIAEDPQRLDLQVFLAQMYLQSGETAKTIDTCGSIVKKLPYCLDANLILAKLLKESNRTEEAQTFERRVQELDPYQAHVMPGTPDKDQVKDQAVLIEQLVWDGGPSIAATDQPEWAAPVGLTLEESRTVKDELPDWMDEEEGESSSPPLLEDISEVDEEMIPDFMKDAGWGPSTGTFDESQSVFDDRDEPIAQDDTEAVEGNIPDWLQHMAPSEDGETIEETSGSQDDVAMPVDDETGDNISDWLMETDSSLELDAGEEISELPDWLRDAVQEKELEEADEFKTFVETEIDSIGDAELPGWLQDVVERDDHESIDDDSMLSHDTGTSDLPQKDKIDQEFMAVGVDEITDTPGVLEPDTSESDLPQGETESEIQTSDEEDIPEWIQEVVQAEDDAEPTLDEVEEDEDEAPIDVIKTAGIAGAALAGVSAVTADDDDQPLSDRQGDFYPDITDEGDTNITEEEPLDERGETEFEDADAAMAWLEGLAAKQGVSEDELLTSPEDRKEEAPVWIQEAVKGEEDSHVSLEDDSEDFGVIPEDLEEPDELLSSLETLDDIPESPAIQESDQVGTLLRSEEASEWLSEITEDMPSIDGDLDEAEVFEVEEIDHPSELKQDFVDDEAIISEDSEEKTPASVDDIKFEADDAGITLTWLEELDIQDAEDDTQETALESVELDQDTIQAEDDFPEVSEIGTLEITEKSDDEPDLTQDITEDQDETGFDDADAALAWLESLAAKQGVSEDELLTSPEERTDTPPDSNEDIDNLSTWLEDIPQDSSQSEMIIDKTDELIVESEPLDGDDAETDADLDDIDAAMAWLENLAAKQGVSEDELLTSPEERLDTPPEWVSASDEMIEPENLSGQTIEDEILSENQVEDVSISPPSWVTDGQVPEDEEITWLPTDESESEDQLLDLNQASLIQLERLPGIGFRRAQSITSYREEHGEFTHIDDLLKVPGIDHDTLELLKTRVAVSTPESEPESILGSTIEDEDFFVPEDSQPDDATHELQLAAQTKFNENKIDEAIADYRELIKNGQRLNAVIDDLKKATQKFPDEVSILQTLGDAYMQADKLQDALEAYTKAENLLQ